MVFMRRSRAAQFALMVIVDAAMVAVGVALAYLARFDGRIPEQYGQYVPLVILVTVIVAILILWAIGLYNVVLRYVGIEVMLRLLAGTVVATAIMFVLNVLATPLLGERPVPLGIGLIAAAFCFVLLGGVRSVGRLWVVMNTPARAAGRPVLIIGAGDAGSLLLRDIENQPQLGYHVVGMLDDDPMKVGRNVRGVKVLGPIDTLPEVVAEKDVAEVLVAIPSLDMQRRREVLEICTGVGVQTQVVKGVVTSAGMSGVSDLQPVRIEDLLGRESHEIDVALISQTLTGKVVAVTGAAGSIGSELCRQIMKMRPARLVLLDVDESRLYELFLELQEALPGAAVMHLCDVRDERKLTVVCDDERPQVVFHAAAYKHVPLMELEPDEAVRANVLGTLNVVNMCHALDVERFVLISTDKAVDPRNVMGATKAIAERITVRAASRGLNAVAVRFGNVLGSRGSVIPIFEEQLRRGGPIKVTHPEVTRYFMTIPEAARLVLQAQAMSEGGDIFVLEMGEPVRIVDLAQRMMVLSGVHTHIEFTGLRPGEKLHEVLVHTDRALMPTECPVVSRVNAIRPVDEDFEAWLMQLIIEARIGDHAGDNPVTRALLARMTGCCLTGEPEVTGAP